jgi:hypothetical protein
MRDDRTDRRFGSVAKARAVRRFAWDLFTIRSAILWAEAQPFALDGREFRVSYCGITDHR